MAHWRGEILSGRTEERDQHLCRNEAPYARDWIAVAGRVREEVEESMSASVEDWPKAADFVGLGPLWAWFDEDVTYRIVACECGNNA